jgi:ParB family chromosome partitioning protein
LVWSGWWGAWGGKGSGMWVGCAWTGGRRDDKVEKELGMCGRMWMNCAARHNCMWLICLVFEWLWSLMMAVEKKPVEKGAKAAAGGVEAGKPRRLGRGLSSLIGEAVRVLPNMAHGTGPQSTEGGGAQAGGEGGELARKREGANGVGEVAGAAGGVADVVEMGGLGGRRLVMALLDEVVESPWQPRRVFEPAALQELADSIKTTGLMQPVVVRMVRKEVVGGTVAVKTEITHEHMAQGHRAHEDGAHESGGGGGVGRLMSAYEREVAERLAAERAGAEEAARRRGMARYELVAGERRWRAARLAGLERIPAVVVEISDQESAEWGLVENLQRADLSAMEKAQAFKRLSSRFGLTHAQIADRLGLGRTVVTHHLSLLQLEAEILALLEAGKLTLAHAKALQHAGFPPGRRRIAEAVRAANLGLSVRALEERAEASLRDLRGMRGGETGEYGSAAEIERESESSLAASAHARQIASLNTALSEKLGTRVVVKGKAASTPGGKRGRIVVNFYSVEQFQGILERLGVRVEG